MLNMHSNLSGDFVQFYVARDAIPSYHDYSFFLNSVLNA